MNCAIPLAIGDTCDDPSISPLVVDDFGVSYEENEHALHLLQTLRKYYDAISVDWKGTLY